MISVGAKVHIPKIKIDMIPTSEWRKIGDDIILGVEDRTGKGKDADGRGFKPYTKDYAKKKGTTRVNLTVTGNMLGSMRNKPSSKGVKVRISGGEDGKKAWAINNKQKRRFMAIGKEDLKKIYKRISKWIAKHN